MRMLSIAEGARLLGVSVFTLRRLIKAGDIRAVNVGSRVLVSSEELDRVMTHGAGVPRHGAARTKKEQDSSSMKAKSGGRRPKLHHPKQLGLQPSADN